MSDETLPPYVTEEQAVSELLARDAVYLLDAKDSEGNPVAGLFVNANDVFWWGCADCEPLAVDDIEDYYNTVKDKPYGHIKWLCMKRKMRPQHPWEEILKRASAWDEKLEELPVRDFTG